MHTGRNHSGKSNEEDEGQTDYRSPPEGYKYNNKIQVVDGRAMIRDELTPELLSMPEQVRYVTLNTTDFEEQIESENADQVRSLKRHYPFWKTDTEIVRSPKRRRIAQTTKSNFEFKLEDNIPSTVIKNRLIKPFPTINCVSNNGEPLTGMPEELRDYYVEVGLTQYNGDTPQPLTGCERQYFDSTKMIFENLRSTVLSSKVGGQKFQLAFKIAKKNDPNIEPTVITSTPIKFVAKLSQSKKPLVEHIVPQKIPSWKSTEVAVLGYFPSTPANHFANICQPNGSNLSVPCKRFGRSLTFMSPLLPNIEKTISLPVYISAGDKQSDTVLLTFKVKNPKKKKKTHSIVESSDKITITTISNPNKKSYDWNQFEISLVCSTTPESEQKLWRILYVEDSLPQQKMTQKLAEKVGAVCDIVNDGFECCTQLSDNEAAKKYSLVLMDIVLPVMDGYDTVQELRRKGFSLPIVGVTALETESEMEQKCLHVGMNAVIRKPLTVEKLKKLLCDLK